MLAHVLYAKHWESLPTAAAFPGKLLLIESQKAKGSEPAAQE